MTDARVFSDDSRVVLLLAAKRYSDQEGVQIIALPVEGSSSLVVGWVEATLRDGLVVLWEGRS
jgi:hypothetical protein